MRAVHFRYHGASPRPFDDVASHLPFTLQHVAVDANHAWQGFIVSNGADAYFQDVTKNTFKNVLYELETLVADAILVSSSVAP